MVSDSEPKAAGDGDGDAVSLVNEESSTADQVRRGSGGSVIYYASASAKSGKQQLIEVNNNSTTAKSSCGNGLDSLDDVTTSDFSNFQRASTIINGNNQRMGKLSIKH